MKLPIELFLCLRYLKPKRTFVSVITLISVLGVTLGVMVLIVVLSVMNGLGRDLRNTILGMDSHITIVSNDVMPNWRQVVAIAEKVPQVRGAAPFVRGPVMMEFGDRILTPMLKGVDSSLEPRVSKITQYLRDGKFDLRGDSAVIGSVMAGEYGIFVGDKITVAGPRVLQAVKKKDEVYLPSELTVTGIFETGMYDYDAYVILASLETAQEIYALGEGVHGVGVMIDEPFRAEPVARELNRQLGPQVQALTWAQQNKTLFAALEVEKNVMFFIMMIISVVAGFCIMNTLITVVVQKTREIGVLKAVGGSDGQILTIFLAQGSIIGLLGVLTGVFSGLVALYFRNEVLHLLRTTTGFEIFPAKIYHFSELPSQIIASDIVWISVSALMICTLAGLVPAWRAARMQPVEALRYE